MNFSLLFPTKFPYRMDLKHFLNTTGIRIKSFWAFFYYENCWNIQSSARSMKGLSEYIFSVFSFFCYELKPLVFFVTDLCERKKGTESELLVQKWNQKQLVWCRLSAHRAYEKLSWENFMVVLRKTHAVDFRSLSPVGVNYMEWWKPCEKFHVNLIFT